MTAIAIGAGSIIPNIGADIIFKSLIKSGGSTPTGILLSAAFLATIKGTVPATKALIDLAEAKVNEYESIKQYTANLKSLNSRIYSKPAPVVTPSGKTKIKKSGSILSGNSNITFAPSKFPTVSEFKAKSVNLGQTGFVSQAKSRSVPISQAINRTIGKLIHNPIQSLPLEVKITDYPQEWGEALKQEEEKNLENWVQLNAISRVGGIKDSNGELISASLNDVNPLEMGITAIPINWDNFDEGWTLGVGASTLLNRASMFRTQSQIATSIATAGILTNQIKVTQVPPPPPQKNPFNWGLPISLLATGALTSSQHQATVNPSTDYPEELLIFLGKCALYEGGADHYEKYLEDKNYYKNVDFPIVDFNVLMSQNLTGYAQAKRQKLNIPNENERQKVLAGIQHLRAGLHEFPAAVPYGLLNLPENKKPENALKLPSFAAFSAWMMKQHDELMGSFPMNFTTKDDETEEQQQQQIPNISTALITLLGLGALNSKVSLRNFNLSQRSAGAVNGTLMNTQFTNEAINALSNCLGCSSNPVVRESTTPCNTCNPKNYKDMLKEKLVKRQGIVDDTSVSVHEKLEKLQFMISVIFNSVYRKKSEFEDEEKKMEDLVKQAEKRNNKDWDKFKSAINKDKNALAKNNVKMKIKELPTDPDNPYLNPIIIDD